MDYLSMNNLVSITLFGTFIYLLFKYLQLKKSLEWAEKIPCSERHFLLGNAGDIKDGTEAPIVKRKWYERFHSVVALWIGPLFVFFLLNDSEGAKEVLKEESPKSLVYDFLYEWLGDGLLTSTGEKWFHRRKLITKIFHFDSLRQYIGVMQDCTEEYVEKMRKLEGKEVDVTAHNSLLALDVICRCAFSYKSDCQTSIESSSFIKAVHAIPEPVLNRVMSPWLFPDFIFYNTSKGKTFLNSIKTIKSFTSKIIDERREEISTGKTSTRKCKDFLDILLEAKEDQETPVKLTNTEIQYQLDTFVFAGHDTTAAGMTWILYNLALFQDYQEQIREEIVSVYGDRDRIDYSDVSKLTFLQMFIKEVFRLYPPVPVFQRVLRSDIHVHGKLIKKGSTVGVNPEFIHQDPLHWENPLEFNPYRFSLENSKGRDPYCYIPFSAGPRNCIGQNFAMLEEKLIVCALLRNFRLVLPPGFQIQREELFVLGSKNGVLVQFVPL